MCVATGRVQKYRRRSSGDPASRSPGLENPILWPPAKFVRSPRRNRQLSLKNRLKVWSKGSEPDKFSRSTAAKTTTTVSGNNRPLCLNRKRPQKSIVWAVDQKRVRPVLFGNRRATSCCHVTPGPPSIGCLRPTRPPPQRSTAGFVPPIPRGDHPSPEKRVTTSSSRFIADNFRKVIFVGVPNTSSTMWEVKMYDIELIVNV
ncbi:hypothetical protein CEXT_67501 [Caerostris extrusa]|uniref:Uncharacterized protein n=1 Tax=Caerostris extrusa TaxID=172846 RepID=A0AAV4XSU7_CAEEX|nr:hypothetical protein CEXT_67501 [Caerostris extrusa]